MGVAGLYARRTFDLIELEPLQCLRWRVASPVSPNDSPSSSSCAPYIASRPRVPRDDARQKRPVFFGARRNSPWLPLTHTAGNLAVATAVEHGRKYMIHWVLSIARRYGCLVTTLRSDRAFLSTRPLISSVTTPAPLGAFFRNEGGSDTPPLPRMEEGTQGVSLSFKEEVACGSGWFPSPGLDGL